MRTWNDFRYLEPKLTNLSAGEAYYGLHEAWKKIFDETPSFNTIVILLSQTALETGRWAKMYNYNWGNIKSHSDDGHYWTMYDCSEIINGREFFFHPPHDQCKFRAYRSVEDGAEDYIRLVSKKKNYEIAFRALKRGDVDTYTRALKQGGYFTANLFHYLKSMRSLVAEFEKKRHELTSWSPPLPSPKELYIEKMVELLAARAAGTVDESAFATELDEYWQQMSADEQDLVEERFGTGLEIPVMLESVSPPAPEPYSDYEDFDEKEVSKVLKSKTKYKVVGLLGIAFIIVTWVYTFVQ